MHSNFPLSRRSTRMRLAVLLSVLTSAACIAGAEAQDPAPDSASMRPRQRPASDAPATPAQPRLTAAQVAGLVQSFYDQTTSFQANFEQEQYTKVYDRRQRSSGNSASGQARGCSTGGWNCWRGSSKARASAM